MRFLIKSKNSEFDIGSIGLHLSAMQQLYVLKAREYLETLVATKGLTQNQKEQLLVTITVGQEDSNIDINVSGPDDIINIIK